MNIILNILFFILNVLIKNTISSNTTFNDVRINYDKTKEIVQNCLNEVLSSLYLNNQVKKMPKIQLLLIIHENLNNVVQHKWKVTLDIKNMVKVENCSATKQVYEYVDEAITAMETDNLSEETELRAIERNLNTSKAIDFFSDLINKINKQSIPEEDTYQINVGNVDKEEYEEGIERRMNDVMQTWQPEESHNETRRVFGGRPVTISQYPFITSVHVLGKFSCSGSIISSNYVISAASCLQPGKMYRNNQRPIEVRIGSDHATVGGEILPALEVIFHPRYDPVNLLNNLAMIKVHLARYAMSVQGKNLEPSKIPMIKKIRMDSLPKNLPKDVVAKGVFILGWGDGKSVMNTKNNHHLTAAFLDLQSLEDCIDIYSAQYVTDKNFCAGLVYKGSGACNGDIGGPAIVLGTLVGIVSFGPPACGTVSDPTVFTKLGYYASWINDVINEKVLKSRMSDRLWLSDTALFARLNPVLLASHEELFVLRKIVDEIDQPGNNISDIIEKDPEIEDEMNIIFQNSTTPVDVAHHELMNKSVLLVPGVHVPNDTTVAPLTEMTTKIVDMGLPDVIPYDHVESLYGQEIADSAELRKFVSKYIAEGTFFKAKGGFAEPKESEILTSIETNENFEYESEGLSIEVPAGGILKADKDLDIEIRPKGFRLKSQNDERTVFDLGDEQHIFNIGGNAPVMPPRDIWFEVKRLRQSEKKEARLRDRGRLSDVFARNRDIAKKLQSLYLSKLQFT